MKDDIITFIVFIFILLFLYFLLVIMAPEIEEVEIISIRNYQVEYADRRKDSGTLLGGID